MKAWISLISKFWVEGEEGVPANKDQSVLDQGTRLSGGEGMLAMRKKEGERGKRGEGVGRKDGG